MSAFAPSWRVQPGPLAAVLAATVLLLLGERLHVFQSLATQQHLHPSADAPCSQLNGSAAADAASTAGAAWRRVADGLQFSPGERSYYASWIEKDLSRWNETGITQQMVDHAHALARLCNPGAMRLQIINGSLWVAHAGPPATGYYPASGGEGALSAAGRVPYFLLSLMEALALFPGQVPDVDLVYQPGDFPCIRIEGKAHDGRTATPPWAKGGGGAASVAGLTPSQLQAMAAPPILGYNGHRGFVDIPWPDYNFWGHEHGGLVDEQGRWLYGWDSQLARYLAAHANLSLAQRWPELVWRGRASTNPRDAVRVRFTGCPSYLQKRNRTAAINLWDNRGLAAVRRLDFCCWRFISYMESMAWSTSFKHKLACGSVVMLPVLEYFEFYSRALQPGVHYIELSHQPGEMCEDIARNVGSMNDWLDALQERRAEQEAPLANSSQAAAAPAQQQQQRRRQTSQAGTPRPANGTQAAAAPSTAAQAPAARRRLQAGSGRDHQQQRRSRQLAAAALPFPPKARDRYSHEWDSDLTPVDVARNAQQFMREHVRMRDVRLYVRDLLIAYAAMQRFKPCVQPGAVRYTGAKLLQECQHPYKADAFYIAARYPWLPEWQ